MLFGCLDLLNQLLYYPFRLVILPLSMCECQISLSTLCLGLVKPSRQLWIFAITRSGWITHFLHPLAVRPGNFIRYALSFLFCFVLFCILYFVFCILHFFFVDTCKVGRQTNRKFNIFTVGAANLALIFRWVGCLATTFAHHMPTWWKHASRAWKQMSRFSCCIHVNQVSISQIPSSTGLRQLSHALAKSMRAY